jgi:hypothetical protein
MEIGASSGLSKGGQPSAADLVPRLVGRRAGITGQCQHWSDGGCAASSIEGDIRVLRDGLPLTWDAGPRRKIRVRCPRAFDPGKLAGSAP